MPKAIAYHNQVLLIETQTISAAEYKAFKAQVINAN